MALYIPLGKVNIPLAGTPVQITANTSVNEFKIKANPTNVGLVYVGKAGMNKTTLVNVLWILNQNEVFPSDAMARAGNDLRASDIYIDADNNNDWVVGFLVER